MLIRIILNPAESDPAQQQTHTPVTMEMSGQLPAPELCSIRDQGWTNGAPPP